MENSISEELSRAFDLATMRQEAAALRTPEKWNQVTDIINRCADARTREERRFATRYHSRVELARRQLVDEAGSRAFDLKPAYAQTDRFDAATLTRQAERQVRRTHHARLARIDDLELRELTRVVERATRENAIRGTAREAFEHTTDRRSGFERRTRPRARER